MMFSQIPLVNFLSQSFLLSFLIFESTTNVSQSSLSRWNSCNSSISQNCITMRMRKSLRNLFGDVSLNKTGTSQVGAISKAQIKSKGDTLETKKIREKVAQCRKHRKKSIYTHPVCRLRLKSDKTKGGPFEIT